MIALLKSTMLSLFWKMHWQMSASLIILSEINIKGEKEYNL